MAADHSDAFDPNAFAETVDFGRRIVREVGERADFFAGPGGPGGPGLTAPEGAGSERDDLLRRLRVNGARAAELGIELIEDAIALIGLIAARSSPDDADGGQTVRVSTSPGAEGATVFWIHNAAAVPMEGVRPHVGALRSHRGDEVAPAAVTFDPPVLDPLPARSRCGIEIRVTPPAATPPGTYDTVILVANAPGVCLPLRLTIGDPDATPSWART